MRPSPRKAPPSPGMAEIWPRRLTCPFYPACLAYAARKRWPGFICLCPPAAPPRGPKKKGALNGLHKKEL